MSLQAVTVTDNQITIRSQYFVTKDNSCINKEYLEDILSNHYHGQSILIEAHDGENIQASGFLGLITGFSMIFQIPLDSIQIETHDTTIRLPFNARHLALGLFLGANKYIPKFERNFVDTKFVGCVIGRFTPARLRLAYELDQAFPNDNYMIFQGRPWSDLNPFKELYSKEMDWFTNKQFDYDIKTTSPVGAVGFDEAYRNYPNIWGRYLIEAVIETDPVSDYWFTEKTAKCLATGKPFVLINGFKSLEQLRSKGFLTYNDSIDESYDSEPTPTRRIHAVVKSLKELYNSVDRDERIRQMYETAVKNQAIYQQYVKEQETTNV